MTDTDDGPTGSSGSGYISHLTGFWCSLILILTDMQNIYIWRYSHQCPRPRLLHQQSNFEYKPHIIAAVISSCDYWVKGQWHPNLRVNYYFGFMILWQLYSHFVDRPRPPAFYLNVLHWKIPESLIILIQLNHTDVKIFKSPSQLPGCPPGVIDCSLHFNAKLNLPQPELSQYFLKTMPTQFSLFIMLNRKNIN